MCGLAVLIRWEAYIFPSEQAPGKKSTSHLSLLQRPHILREQKHRLFKPKKQSYLLPCIYSQGKKVFFVF